MIRQKSITVIIPCYNEEEGLEKVLATIPKTVDSIIVVDNNSDDNTASIAKRCGALVFKEKQQGYGYAYKKGFSVVKSDIIVTLDGDGTYPTHEIERLVNILLQENLEFISACRFPLSNPKSMDIVSKFGNWVLTTATKILFGKKIKDSQSGMWVFYRHVLDKIRLESNGMALSEEIKIECIKRKIRFKEVHIPYYQRYGKKKIKKFQDGFRNLIFLLKLKVRK
ncbi:MAG: glycosyltransferase family 2 protein [Bacteroidia bacterium]|nr:glycosyltransferase family 2 protein [Bacteroidia bacterium]MDW8346567.1 glycosyltransferase family 2 protein [Bacteroidia bacterium]